MLKLIDFPERLKNLNCLIYEFWQQYFSGRIFCDERLFKYFSHEKKINQSFTGKARRVKSPSFIKIQNRFHIKIV